MLKMELSEITIENIKGGKLKGIIPELYELNEVVENNLSHSNEPTLTHIISVRKELEILLKDAKKSVKDYLSSKIDSHSRGELLLFSSVFHDIGKKETITKQGDESSFPGHEEVSADKVKEILQRFALSDGEKDFVVRVIKHHGLLYDLPEQSSADIEKEISEFRKKQFDIYLAVVLHAKADLLSNQLKDNNPEAFKIRLDFLNGLLGDY